MKNIWTVAYKDFRGYFNSPVAYIVLAAFLVIMGIMFFNNLSWFALQNLQHQQFNMGKSRSMMVRGRRAAAPARSVRRPRPIRPCRT